MKKLFLSAVTVVCSLLLITSCDGSKNTQLLEGIPSDTDVVVVGDLKTVVESAGGSIKDSKIVLPKTLADEMPSDVEDEFDKMNDMLKNSGVDVNNFAMSGNFKDKKQVYVGLVNDRKKLEKFLSDNDFDEDDKDGKLTIYRLRTYESSYSSDYNKYAYVGVTDSHVYLITDVRNSIISDVEKQLKRMVSDLADGTYADGKTAEFLKGSNAAAMVMKLPKDVRRELRDSGIDNEFTSLLDGYLCIKGELTGDKATVTVKILNEEGKAVDTSAFEKYYDANAKISKKALAFLSADQSIVASMALKDYNWNKLLDNVAESMYLSRQETAMLSAAKGYLQRIDGTFAMGIGVKGGLEAFSNEAEDKILEYIDFTIVVETKSGETKSLLNELKGLLDQTGLPYDNKDNGLRINLLEIGGSIYCEAVDNFLVLSNSPIKDANNNPVVKAFPMSDYISAVGAVLNKDSKLAQDLYIEYDVEAMVYAEPKTMESVMTLQLKGGKEQGVLAKLIDMVMNIVNHEQQIEEKMYPQRSYYDDPYADFGYGMEEAAADSLVVAPVEVEAAEAW